MCRIQNLRQLLLVSFVFLSQYLSAQEIWKSALPDAAGSLLRKEQTAIPADGKYRLMELNQAGLQQLVANARFLTGEAGRIARQFTLELPLPSGGFVKAWVEESSISSPEMERQIPDLRTYKLTDPATRSSLGRISISKAGVTGLIFTPAGSVYIHPVEKNTHIIYHTSDLQIPKDVRCALTVSEDELNNLGNLAGKTNAGDCQLRTYRLAVAATGEYYTWAGSSYANSLAYITICINTVNAIYERDAAIRFTIVTTSDIVYTDAATDPYGTTLNGTLLTANNNATDFELGAGNYDVGILFNNAWDGGLAQLNSVCTIDHGRSAAGLTFGTGANPTPGPQGPVFDAMVAHEIAHQFSATHTMAASNGGCSGNNTASSAWEPGGGSTIMAYAGVCTGNAYQNYPDLVFHTGNIAQIANYATLGNGNTCPTTTALSNTAPNVTVAGTSYTIPALTPFVLTAVGTDNEANTLTYSWEQMDANAITTLSPQAASVSGPNFRVMPPSENPTRYFPNLPALINGTATPYEVLPSSTRTLNFRVNVRDNASGGGCNVQEDVAVSTDASGGPFTVTSQSTPVALVANGSNTFTVTWNVANTNAAPFNTSNVTILFSADGGANFNYTLLTSTSNDGSESIIVPNFTTSAGRIMVRAVGNIFFNVNAANISISSSCPAEGANLTPSNTVTATPGSPSLNLAVAPNYGSAVFPTSGASLTAGDPAATLAVYNAVTPGCINFSNEFRYDLYTFQVNVSGSYAFGKSAGNYIMNLYQGSFTPGTPCANLITSNGSFDGTFVNIGGSITATLTAGVSYVLAVGTFSNTTPAKPFAYTISLTSTPPGGGAYSGFPDPGAGYSYAYVIVNNATGNIVEIRSTPDLSNSTQYPGGTYSVYGLSYETASFSTPVLDAYESGPLTDLTNDLLNDPAGSCGNLSKNSVPVNIFGLLPVELLPLEATLRGTGTELNWATASELNSEHFEIERSADGRLFESIGLVQAAGNSSFRINYQWLDQSPLPNGNYYRIKAVNIDEAPQYSNVVFVRMNTSSFKASVSPNPFNQQTKLLLSMPESGNIRIAIYNSVGLRVWQQQMTLINGQHQLPINTAGLASGSYFLIVETGRERAEVKLQVR